MSSYLGGKPIKEQIPAIENSSLSGPTSGIVTLHLSAGPEERIHHAIESRQNPFDSPFVQVDLAPYLRALVLAVH
jgi:hypothetical protein